MCSWCCSLPQHVYEGKCKTWTLDSGLDSWTGLWTEIWTRFWTDAQVNDDHFQVIADRRYYNCKIRSHKQPRKSMYPGPSGYEAKSQGAGLEATCRYVEVDSGEHFPAWKIGERGMALLTGLGMNFNIETDAYRGKGGHSTIPPRSSYVKNWDIKPRVDL